MFTEKLSLITDADKSEAYRIFINYSFSPTEINSRFLSVIRTSAH